MSSYLDKAQLEIVTVNSFRELGYEYIHGPAVAPERADYAQVVLTRRLRDALGRKLANSEINPGNLPEAEAIGEEVEA